MSVRLAVFLCILLGVTLSSNGCKQGSTLINPDQESFNSTDDIDGNILRNPQSWYSDFPVMDGENAEKNVDITNVVYDTYHSDMGEIKKASVPDPYFYTVATWGSEDISGNKSVWFRVLYRSAEFSGLHQSTPIEVDPGPEQKAAPAITAYVHECEGNIMQMYVSIIYQQRQDEFAPWQIWHARYRQIVDPLNYNFDSFELLFAQRVHYEIGINLKNPDIVFDALPDFEWPIQMVHMVFEAEISDTQKDIIYVSAIDELDEYMDCTRKHHIISPGLNCMPRIDVGYDDSGFTYDILGLDTSYYVGIVWHQTGMISRDWVFSNILFTGFKPGGYPNGPILYLTHADPILEYIYKLPDIDIEPIENMEYHHPCTTVIVWMLEDRNDGDLVRMRLYYTHSIRMMQYSPEEWAFQTNPGLPSWEFWGFPKIATKGYNFVGFHGSANITFLRMLKVDYPPEMTDVEVHACRGNWDVTNGLTQWYDSTEISDTDAALSIHDEGSLGTEIAILDSPSGSTTLVHCIWTDFRESANSAPSIYGSRGG